MNIISINVVLLHYQDKKSTQLYLVIFFQLNHAIKKNCPLTLHQCVPANILQLCVYLSCQSLVTHTPLLLFTNCFYVFLLHPIWHQSQCFSWGSSPKKTDFYYYRHITRDTKNIFLPGGEAKELTSKKISLVVSIS